LQIQPIVEPRWYQVAACESAIRAGRSIVKIATGGGKTAVAALIIAQLNVRTLFLVHTKDLLRQARDAIGEYLGRECGQIGDGVVDPRDVTIATIQTISRALGKCYKKDEYSEEDEDDDTDVTNRVDIIRECVDNTTLLMQDEVHRVASKSAFEVSNLVKHAVYHVGFGASPWRDDGADMIIEAAFGCPSFVMTASELIDMGYLMQPTIVFRHIYERLQPRGTYDQIYKDWVVDNPINNGLVVADTRSILSEGREVMVLVKQIKHGEILKGMLRSEGVQCEFLSGKDGSDVRYRAINDMRSRKLKCLIATTIADEGLDIRPLDGLILAGRGKSSVRALQRVGRTLRPYDKLNPKIIDYYDRVRFLEAHTCRRMQIYATEPKFNLDMSEVNRT
jgi:superfamily II DNA or RNA helicase